MYLDFMILTWMVSRNRTTLNESSLTYCSLGRVTLEEFVIVTIERLLKLSFDAGIFFSLLSHYNVLLTYSLA